jgi:hypothetical protein
MLKNILLLAVVLFPGVSGIAQTTFYVDVSRHDNAGAGTSWAAAKKDLQAAINIAGVGDQVWVKAGIYLPTQDPFGNTAPANNRDKTFLMKNGVAVYGGFAGNETQLSQRNWQANITTLSGDLGVVNTLTDNAYHVVLAVNVGASSLNGLTITKGYAVSPTSSITVGGRVINRHHGGGIYNTNTGAAFINCTIKGNSADCTDGNDDALGAGVMNNNCSSLFSNCVIEGNSFLAGGSSFGVFGAGMYTIASNGVCTISNCAFVNNTSGSGFFDGSRGGALYLSAGSNTITNTIFYNNISQNGAAVAYGGAGSCTPAFTNCTFANNTSSYAGTAFSGFAKASFRNCIFWNNVPTVNPVAGRNEILSQETNVTNQPGFTNCIIRDASGSPLSVTNTIITNSLNSNPLFVNLADGDGPDNIFLTADDGIRLQCSSPAINAGTGATPTLDILGLPRTGIIDMGAYEGGHANLNVNALPTLQTTVQLSQNASGVTHYADCSNKLVEIQSGGSYTLSGTVTATVWVENTQPASFVKRHYEIAPQQNPLTATGRVTLYFRQQEFDDFNAVNTLKLPTGPADAAGFANIRIEKRGGISSNGTGLPLSYPGAIQTIHSGALSVVWNTTATRWEIAFDVAGFSGFFLKTQLSVLPLRLLSFSGTTISGCNALQWQTANEVNTKEFIVQRSKDGQQFERIGSRDGIGMGDNRYQFNDCAGRSAAHFYRLKMVDTDGSFTYSNILLLKPDAGISISLYPNPAQDMVVISGEDASLLNSEIRIVSADGTLLKRRLLTSFPFRLAIADLLPGVYQLQFANGTTLGMIKGR